MCRPPGVHAPPNCGGVDLRAARPPGVHAPPNGVSGVDLRAVALDLELEDRARERQIVIGAGRREAGDHVVDVHRVVLANSVIVPFVPFGQLVSLVVVTVTGSMRPTPL